jgi:L-fucose dehydrogenase
VDLRLKGKVILVGGANEIGASIGRACVGEGAVPVIVNGHAEAGAAFITADLSRAGGYAQAVTEGVRVFGRIDALVNCASESDEAWESQNSADFVDSLSRYLAHYYSMTHYALLHLRQSKGVIVNIAANTNTLQQGGYLCAKGAIQALTREWAAELLPYGIRVNMVIPGAGAPKGLTAAKEIAAATLFLISPESAHTTGQHLNMNVDYADLRPSV